MNAIDFSDLPDKPNFSDLPDKSPDNNLVQDPNSEFPTLGKWWQIANKTATELLPAMAKGAFHGATFDVGSKKLQTPEINPAPSGYTRTGFDVGHFIGSALPIMGAEAVAARMIPQLAAQFGWGAVQAAIAKAGLTGAIYGTSKGAARGTPPLETAKDTAGDMATFMGLGAAGQGLGKARQWISGLAEDNANYFLNTPNKISADRLGAGEFSMKEGDVIKRGGEPTLGRTYLDIPELKGARNKLEAYNRSSFEIGRLENQIRGQMDVLGQGKTISLDGMVDRNVFNNVMQDILPELQRYDPRSASLVKKVLTSPNVTDLDALELRRILDSFVGNKYLSSEVSTQTDAIKGIANALRDGISKEYPDLAGMLGKQHDLLQIRDSLAPYTVPKHRIGDLSSMWGDIKSKIKNSPAVFQTINSQFGKPSTVIAPAARQGTRALSEEIKNKNRGN